MFQHTIANAATSLSTNQQISSGGTPQITQALSDQEQSAIGTSNSGSLDVPRQKNHYYNNGYAIPRVMNNRKEVLAKLANHPPQTINQMRYYADLYDALSRSVTEDERNANSNIQYDYSRHAAYYFALGGVSPVLTSKINRMVSMNRELVLEDMKRAEESDYFNHNPLYYAEIYSILSQHPTEKDLEQITAKKFKQLIEKEVKQIEDVSYYYLSRSAWLFALAQRQVELSSKLNKMYECNSELMLIEAENVGRLMVNPFYGQQLYETLAKCSLKFMLAQSKIAVAFEQVNININNRPDILSRILSSGLVVSELGVTKFKSGQYSIKGKGFEFSIDVNFSASNHDSNRESGVLKFSFHSSVDIPIENILYQGDIGGWLYNAGQLALQCHRFDACEAFIDKYTRINTEHAILVACGHFEPEPSMPSLVRFHLLNEPSFRHKMEKTDLLLRSLIKLHLFKKFKELVKGRTPAFVLEELDALARYNISKNNVESRCDIALESINAMIDLDLSYAQAQACKEENVQHMPIYCALIYKAMAAHQPEGMGRSECYRWAGYYYSFTNRQQDCVSAITQFVGSTNNTENVNQPKEDALNAELQKSSPFYCAEIFNQLVKQHRYQGQQERMDYLNSACRLYSAAGATTNAYHVIRKLNELRHSNQANESHGFFQPASSSAAATAVGFYHSGNQYSY